MCRTLSTKQEYKYWWKNGEEQGQIFIPSIYKRQDKFWVLADSLNGYTYDFDLYLGKQGKVSSNGLGYDVVMKLCNTLYNQGYRLHITGQI